MRTTLLAFGFEHEPPIIRGSKIGHNAGNDAIRIIAILLNIFTYDSTLKIPQNKQRHRKYIGTRLRRHLLQDDRFFRGRPYPWQSYPFVTRVSLNNHVRPTFLAKGLYNTFNRVYNIAAVGTNDINSTPPYDIKRNNNFSE